MAKVGNPGKYKAEFVDQVFKLCLVGLIDEEIAKVLGVSVATLNNWKHKYPEFLESLKRGRSAADGNVTKSLYQRACGYSHPEDKIFMEGGKPVIVPTIKHYPPDPISCIFWLKNRQPSKWRDKVPEFQESDQEVKPVSIEFVVEDGSKKDKS